MTDTNYTHWHLVIDRSGSMNVVKEDAQGGINAAFAAQRALPGKLTVSLTQFDSEIETIARMTNIRDVAHYTLEPRGSTALLDAVGRAIVETGEDLAALPEGQRPSKVLIQIVTDGQENASREWTLAQIRDLIKQQQETYNWVFAFIGTPDAAAWGQRMGTNTVTTHAGTRGSTQSVYAASSSSLGSFRSGQGYTMPDVVEEQDVD